MTEEDDTVQDVRRDADEEHNGIAVAEDDVVYDGVSLVGDDVVGVVPLNKAVYVTVTFAVIVVDANLPYCRHCVRNQGDHITSCDILFSFLFPQSAVMLLSKAML